MTKFVKKYWFITLFLLAMNVALFLRFMQAVNIEDDTMRQWYMFILPALMVFLTGVTIAFYVLVKRIIKIYGVIDGKNEKNADKERPLK